MKPYQNILVGVNYTDSSRHALQQANRLAKESGAILRAFHAVSSVELNEFTSFYFVEQDTMMRSALQSLEVFVEDILGADHGVICTVEEGIPHHEVVSQAQEIKADLLVLGSDDYATDPRNSGKFAIKCLRFATMPVLLVRNQADRPFARIITCIDFSESTIPALKNTGRMAFDDEQMVEIVHAVRPPWLRPGHLRYQTEVFENKEQKEQFHEILNGQIYAIVQSASEFLTAKPSSAILEHENPEYAILDYLEESHSELAIIGRWGKGAKGIKTDLLGGTAETLIRHARCSLLIVPIIT